MIVFSFQMTVGKKMGLIAKTVPVLTVSAIVTTVTEDATAKFQVITSEVNAW